MTQPRSKRQRVEYQSLESRELLASFGTPWPEPRELTISFPSDGTKIGSYESAASTNDAAETLDAIASRQEWQELALRAFQTWSIHADINVGLRNDHDLNFGVPGLSASDPRFGDFRIGATPQLGVLANSLPFQPAAGTFSGDIFLNSNENFQYHDWAGGLAPDPSTIDSGERDLFSVLLHETGNALGVDDNLFDWTVMFRQYTQPKGTLTTNDIQEIQSLYGVRTDPYETSSNDQLEFATLIPTPTGFSAATDVIGQRGSLLDASDTDHYQFQPVSGQDSVVVRLNASGISLLKSKLQVMDSTGQILAEANAASVFDNNVELEVSGLSSHSELSIRVVAEDPTDVYSVGDYVIELDYRDPQTIASSVFSLAYDAGIDSLFTNFDLHSIEQGLNDVVSDAEALIPISDAIADGKRYEFVSSVSSPTDVDHWQVVAPSQIDGPLSVHVAGVGADQAELQVRIVDSTGQPVGARGRILNDGTWVMEVAQPVANEEYVVRISVDPNSSVGQGNYVVTAEYEAPPQQLENFSAGSLGNNEDQFIRWTAGKTKLYRFDLSTEGTANDLVKLSIYDAHTLEIRTVVSSNAGSSRTVYALLTEGEYILRFTSVMNSSAANIQYSLLCDGLSDDQDDDDTDPEDGDGYDPYAYYTETDVETDPYGDYDYYYYYYYYP